MRDCDFAGPGRCAAFPRARGWVVRGLATAAVLAALAVSAAASGGAKKHVEAMPDGRYNCLLSFSIVLGDMIIDEGTFVGPSRHPENHRPARFERREDGTILWRGSLAALEEEGLRLVSSRVVNVGGGIAGFTMQVANKDGDVHAVACELTK